MSQVRAAPSLDGWATDANTPSKGFFGDPQASAAAGGAFNERNMLQQQLAEAKQKIATQAEQLNAGAGGQRDELTAMQQRLRTVNADFLLLQKRLMGMEEEQASGLEGYSRGWSTHLGTL